MTSRTLAPHLLSALATAQLDGRSVALDELTKLLGVRRTDIRAALSALHREGLINVMTMRLTMRGFALGLSFAKKRLPALRREGPAFVRAA